jgi:hypothetical protein
LIETLEDAKIIKDNSIVLLDPIKKINEYSFGYSLVSLKRNPKAKQNQKKAQKEKLDLTTC